VQPFLDEPQARQLQTVYRQVQEWQYLQPTDSNVAALLRAWRWQLYPIYRHNFENQASPWFNWRPDDVR